MTINARQYLSAESESPATDDTIRSVAAYLLPQEATLPADATGKVARIFVHERQLVVRGQALAEVDPDVRATGVPSLVLRAGRSGFVSRCWARVGDTVRAGEPVASVLRCEDVLVLALFDRAQLERARLTSRATVSIGEPPQHQLQADVLRIGTGQGEEGKADPPDRMIRVVVQMPSVPPEALRPGIDISVYLRCA